MVCAMRTRSLRWPALLVAGLLSGTGVAVIAGCSSPAEGVGASTTPSLRPPTPAVTTPSTSAAPSPTPPLLPEAARHPDRAGAEAFFRYFMDVYTYTFVSQDSSVLRAISASDCKFCASTMQDAGSAGARHLRTVGAAGTTKYVSAAPGEPTQGMLVNAIVDQGPFQVLDDQGKVVDSGSGDRDVRMDAAVRWYAGAWQLRGLHVFPKSHT